MESRISLYLSFGCSYRQSCSVNTYMRFTCNDFKNFIVIVIFVVIVLSVKGPLLLTRAGYSDFDDSWQDGKLLLRLVVIKTHNHIILQYHFIYAGIFQQCNKLNATKQVLNIFLCFQAIFPFQGFLLFVQNKTYEHTKAGWTVTESVKLRCKSW